MVESPVVESPVVESPVVENPVVEGASAWRLDVAETELPEAPGITHTHWTLARPPGGDYDRIGVHRYRAAETSRSGDSSQSSGPVLFYLPGTFMHGAPSGLSERYDPWLFLARRGVQVFTFDYRTHEVPVAAEDLSPLAAWGIDLFAGDVHAGARWALEQSGARALFVAGFSRGAGFAYGQAAAHPETVAGIVALDGYFKGCAGEAGGPDTGGAENELEQQLAAWRATGDWVSDVAGSRGWEARAALMSRALEAADGAREDPAQEQHRTTLAEVLHKAWGPGVLAHPREVSPRGVSRAPVLAQLMDDYDRYYPKVQDLEARAAAAVMDHPALAVDDGWAELRKPVLFFGSTGMGAEFLLGGVHSATHVGGPRAQIHVLEGYGHLDVLVAEEAQGEVFEPLLEWLRRHSTEP